MIKYIHRRDSDGKYWADVGVWVKKIEDAHLFSEAGYEDEGETAIPVRVVIEEPSSVAPDVIVTADSAIQHRVVVTKEEQERAFLERNFDRVISSGETEERAGLEADLATKEWRKRWGSK